VDDSMPFRVSDWPTPRGEPYPRFLRIFTESRREYLSQGVVMPFALTDWPNPTRKTYPASLLAFFASKPAALEALANVAAQVIVVVSASPYTIVVPAAATEVDIP
jgi:hypothetical protein